MELTPDELHSLFAEYLRTGAEIFGLEKGAVLTPLDGELAIAQTYGPGPHDSTAVERTAIERGTTACWDAGHFRISTPIRVEGAVFAALSFWSERSSAAHPRSKEIIEMIAAGIGSAINQRRLAVQLAHQAKHDSLTGLPNRVLLQERLQTAIGEARDSSGTVAVLFIDLDMFKQINDTLGHSAGDAVLEQVAKTLSRSLAPGDTLARMGGDEFTAILRKIGSADDAVACARRVLSAVRAPVVVNDYELFVTASIGISLYPRDGDDAATLLRNADAAMYDAKYRGKNDVHCYQAQATATALQRLEIETQLRRALERGELSVFYQPEMDREDKIATVEVLLTWEHPELGRIPPSQFIPIAEDTGMILQIGSWVIEGACEVIARWRAIYGARFPIAVNVSALQFAQANFASTIARILARHGLPPQCLELELTESVVMRDIEQSSAVLRALRAIGVRIALDDFGTGYSSLSYLRRLPADVLKIDQSFLFGIETQESAFALVNAVAMLGHTFGLTVTAEGVETQRQLELVRKAGCDRAQGHLFGEALREEGVEDLLRR